jgi:serine/threonine protein kinase
MSRRRHSSKGHSKTVTPCSKGKFHKECSCIEYLSEKKMFVPSVFFPTQFHVLNNVTAKGGARTFIVEDKENKQKYVLKLFSSKLEYAKREIHTNCNLTYSSDKILREHIPQVVMIGNTNASNPFAKRNSKPKKTLFMIIEFIQGHTLTYFLKNKLFFDEVDTCSNEYDHRRQVASKLILLQILMILKRMHKKHLLQHNDLHTNNILITSDKFILDSKVKKGEKVCGPKVYIIDFGLTKYKSGRKTPLFDVVLRPNLRWYNYQKLLKIGISVPADVKMYNAIKIIVARELHEKDSKVCRNINRCLEDPFIKV